MSTLKEVIDNARFGKKRDLPLKFMLNLLALCANARLNEKGPIIAGIVEALPKLSEKRAGGDYGGIDRSVADFFLSYLEPDFEMPNYGELGLPSGLFFTDELIESAFAKLKATEENERLIERVRAWLEGGGRASQSGADEGRTARKERVERKAHIEKPEAVPLDASWTQPLDKIKKYLELSDTRIKNLLSDLDEKNSRILDLSSRIEAIKGDDASAGEENKARISSLLEEISGYKSHIVRCEDDLKQKDQEIEERKLLQIRDRAEAEKSSEDFRERLASELRFDYNQFKDAMTMEMHLELGEIMRDKLKSVFKILEKIGLNIEYRYGSADELLRNRLWHDEQRRRLLQKSRWEHDLSSTWIRLRTADAVLYSNR
jgi:hypothetical protein